MNILLLSPYPPYPPYGGGTMRIYQLLRGLAQSHNVTCLSFAPDQAAADAMQLLREFVSLEVVIGPPARSLPQRAFTTLASPLPDMALRNQSQAYSRVLRSLLQRQPFDIIQAESIEMAPYLLEIACSSRRHGSKELYSLGVSSRASMGRGSIDRKTDSSIVKPCLSPKPLLVLDQFNVEYILQKRAALTSFRAVLAPGLRPATRMRQAAGALYSLAQWQKLKRYERRLLSSIPAVLAVSEEDAQSFRELNPQACLGVVPNGVDTAEFSRAALPMIREPVLKRRSIVFSGTLDFRANIDAVVWLAEQVLPLVRRSYPDIECVVVGKRPTVVLEELARAGQIRLTGEVPDARPYLAEAAVYVVPMRIGGGIRLKLLEALSLEVPLVSTSMGAEGIEGLEHARHCLIADSPEDFATAIMQLLQQPELGRRLAAAGRELMLQSYDWRQIVPKLEAFYGSAKG